MDLLTWAGGALCLALAAYLLFAMLWPERLS
jgi:K+-transporting ATPase KdpF subunit